MAISAIKISCEYSKYIVNRKYSKLLPIHRVQYSTQPDYYVEVPCGRCRLCKARLAKEWKVRLANELLTTPTHTVKLQQVPRVIFGTLTFNDASYTDDESLLPDYFVKFRDSYRKRYGISPRYFAVTDRGSQFGRLHVHILIFNPRYYDRKTKTYTKNVSVTNLREHNLWWPYGFVSYLAWCNSSAVSSYVSDYISGANMWKEEPVKHGKPICEKALRYKPRIYCSKGIGSAWLTDEKIYEYNAGATPLVLLGGFHYVLPRYYRNRIWPSEDREFWAYDHRHLIRRAEVIDYMCDILFREEDVRYKYLNRFVSKEELERLIIDNERFVTPEKTKDLTTVLPDIDYSKDYENNWLGSLGVDISDNDLELF